MKFSAHTLFKERAAAYFAEIQKYTRYMLNDHLLFVLVFALGAFLFYYSGWVKTIDESFPAALLMALSFGVLLAWSPVYTYLKQADAVYLLPLETALTPYFHKAVWTSFLSQSYVLVALLALFLPMHAAAGGEMRDFLLFLTVILVVKVWNLWCRFGVLHHQEPEYRRVDTAIRFLLNVGVLWAVFSGALSAAVFGVFFMILWLFYMRQAGKKPLKWELLVQLESKRMAAFYRFANLFTDVPHLRGSVKRRAWLDSFLPNAKSGAQRYLLYRTFVRMDEYSGLFVRLSVIGAIVIAMSGTLAIQLIAALLLLYLTGFQLLPMVTRHDGIIWTHLYPVGDEGKEDALRHLLTRVLLVQSVLFGVCALSAGLLAALIVLSASAAFSLFFSHVYAPNRLKKFR